MAGLTKTTSGGRAFDMPALRLVGLAVAGLTSWIAFTNNGG